MSETISALNNAGFSGLVRIDETGLQGMITLRGDLSLATVKKVATTASGAAFPGQRQITVSDTGALAWMSPDELLILCPYEDVSDRLAKMTKSLGNTNALAVDVSDARAIFAISGEDARDVMAKLCPVDLHPEVFKPGEIRRTRLAQIAAAIWMEDDDTFRLICFRSVAQYAYDALKVAAAAGSAVGFHAAQDPA
ncbi:sarcosine oxidase subunit gamma [Phaeobacter sp. 22II1-1F12B]|uniref:sarcosine oxidase subunit gamma n=1 Tax=Phaeobacter sp. 22II1-1F12B TaxID=1317111 RepID=UPI000B51FB37|nr:sarcosine oxidase subunit gamma family protein [Phaeobacter sp. 22II1-1F12B]OWU81562.1 sarcosine oxidase subunit gamma [Phaeobacter sp. 22II1-1F12B]